LNAEEAKHILGGQANVWCEWIPTEARAEYMIWPRMAAMAEVLWSPKKGRDTNEFLGRMSSIFPRLDRLDTSYYLPAPRVAMAALLFSKSARVAAIQDKGMPGRLHYSLDGAVPTANSPIYTGPITVTKLANVKFAYLTKTGKPGEVAEVDCRPVHLERVANPKPGLKFAYYDGEWEKVPDFTKLKPASTGRTGGVGLTMHHEAENFAVHLSGYFKAAKEGVYDFGLSSDDGSLLKVGGALVVDNDGPHGNSEKRGKIWLPKGWHKIEIGFYQGGGAFALSLNVQTPGAGQPVAAEKFVYTEGR